MRVCESVEMDRREKLSFEQHCRRSLPASQPPFSTHQWETLWGRNPANQALRCLDRAGKWQQQLTYTHVCFTCPCNFKHIFSGYSLVPILHKLKSVHQKVDLPLLCTKCHHNGWWLVVTPWWTMVVAPRWKLYFHGKPIMTHYPISLLAAERHSCQSLYCWYTTRVSLRIFNIFRQPMALFVWPPSSLSISAVFQMTK